MRIIPIKDAVFEKIEDALSERQEETQLEVLAGIDCDDQDLANQDELGEEDPVATIELIVQWLPDTGEGVLDWFFVRVSGMETNPPDVQHGGPLLGFNCQGAEPDLDALILSAVGALNQAVEWAEFELEEDA
ncbi:MAG: hypothetical protein KJO21_07750 [Verrucomicrobiae bacterium]|nr:hypothetical protein [Verrucomicrobiae bacterium]NNJ43367.1 hypothetical protein [Akkermansiaceae bacterium]